ncbi:MAG: hypothetical protein D6820_06955, partial [Lentisphaerae bacterium]
MKIIFLSPYLPGSILIIALVVTGFSVYIYRLHHLHSSARYWLPLLRSITIMLFILAILQPILIWEKSEEKQGRIAVLVDDSASMNVTDAFATPEKVFLADRFQLIPPGQRCRLFQQQSVLIAKETSKLNSFVQAFDRLFLSKPHQSGSQYNVLQKKANHYLSELAAMIDRSEKLGESAFSKWPYLADCLKRQSIPEYTRQGLLYRRWNNIPGWELSKLYEFIAEGKEADQTQIINNLSMPRNVGSSYGARIQGYLTPPITGEYTFLLCSDDQGAFYLSSDHTLANRKLICHLDSWVPFGDFNRFPGQQSPRIFLAERQYYYIEGWLKENYGDDHFIVGWIRPDGKKEIPIPVQYIHPYGVIFKDYLGPPIADLMDHFRQLTSQSQKLIRKLKDAIPQFSSSPQTQRPLAESIKNDFRHLVRLGNSISHLLQRIQQAADVEFYAKAPQDIQQALARIDQMSRYDWTRQVLFSPPTSLLEALSDKGPVDLFLLSNPTTPLSPDDKLTAPPNHPATPMFQALQSIITNYAPGELSTIILLSDGNTRSDANAELVKLIRKEQNLPIYAIYPASSDSPRDISILSVTPPTATFAGDVCQIKVRLRISGFGGQLITVQLRDDDTVLTQTNFYPSGIDVIQELTLQFVPPRSGTHQYTVYVPPKEQERITLNNTHYFSISTLNEKIPVLVVFDFPDWTIRHCIDILHRDKRIKVDVLPGLPTMAHTTSQPLPVWPQGTIDERMDYQAIIMSVANPENLNPEFLNNIRKRVENHGSSLIILWGKQMNISGYLSSPLASLLPFAQANLPASTPATVTTSIQLPDSSYCPPEVQLGPSLPITAALWKELPALTTHTPPSLLKTATVLLETTQHKIPVLIRSKTGLGKTYLLTARDLWRWHKKIGNLLPQKFWLQLLISSSTDHVSSPPHPYIRLQTRHAAYSPSDPIPVHLYAQYPSGIPLTAQKIMLECLDAKRHEIQTLIEMFPVRNMPGHYRCKIPPLPAGHYQLHPIIPDSGSSIPSPKLTINVLQNPSQEFLDVHGNLKNLQKFTSRTIRFYDPIQPIIDETQPRRFTRVSRETWELWDSALVFILACITLT